MEHPPESSFRSGRSHKPTLFAGLLGRGGGVHFLKSLLGASWNRSQSAAVGVWRAEMKPLGAGGGGETSCP